MNRDNHDAAEKKSWTAPVLNQLTVDLNAIATDGKGAGDSTGSGNANKKS